MADWISWFVVAGVLVILEIFTGTFYLLMIAVGLAVAGLAALLGVSASIQYIVAAIVGVIATYALRRSKFGRAQKTSAARDPNVNLDIGQTLVIKDWNKEPDGQSRSRAMYRGAMWDVDLAHGAVAQAGTFTIQEIRGSRLIVTSSTNKQ